MQMKSSAPQTIQSSTDVYVTCSEEKNIKEEQRGSPTKVHFYNHCIRFLFETESTLNSHGLSVTLYLRAER